MKNDKAFTVVELLSVLVILTIISLILTPHIVNIVTKVRNDINRRSVDGYGRAVEYAMAHYQLKNSKYPDEFDQLEIEYNGNNVVCETSRINYDYSIYLSGCKVNGRIVKDDKEIDGYYHYGELRLTNEEYVSLYGKNLEKAIANYYSEYDTYPQDYSLLKLDYIDKTVKCDVSINYDGKVYLTACNLDGEEVKDLNTDDGYYHYGNFVPSYVIGDEIIYKGIEFYVIKDSTTMSENVTLLKKEPLTVDEVNTYGGVGTENNHVNRYTKSSIGTAYNYNGYGGMTYYSSETCGYLEGVKITTGCTTDYMKSEIKYVVDAWALDELDLNDLSKDQTGYSARLITMDEYENIDATYSWRYSKSYNYWTMSPQGSSNIYVYRIYHNGNTLNSDIGTGGQYPVRPVINLRKSAI